MPSYTEKQRRFMGAELGRKRAGKETRTGMSEKQLSEFASGVRGSKHSVIFRNRLEEQRTRRRS